MLALESPASFAPSRSIIRTRPAFVVGGSGHRPHKLASKPDCYSKALRQRLTQLALKHLQELEASHVISGIALGWDMALAIAALKLHIPLICALPFEGHETRWNLSNQRLYHRILKRAEQVIVTSPGGYSLAALQQRNEWIVDHSHHLLVLWNQKQSSTAHCAQYAKQQGVPTRNLWREWQRQ